MKYYSEETVKNMLKDTRVEILTRNRYGSLVQDFRIIRPKAEDYPSIEIPEPHGRIIDEKRITSVETHKRGDVYSIEVEAPTILEASE